MYESQFTKIGGKNIVLFMFYILRAKSAALTVREFSWKVKSLQYPLLAKWHYEKFKKKFF